MSSDLGSLEPVDPRDVWAHEAHDFTPWLLENAQALGDALGLEIELETSEESVGSFAVDLVGRDLTHDQTLIVENQLGATDHGHLGQILTYAAGTGAATVIWVSTDLREEHRQALDWLNEHTDEDVRFFGVVLGVVRISDSPPAPLFSVVAQPNDWQKRVKTVAKGRLSPRRQQYQQFWTRYIERVRVKHPGWTKAHKPGTENWMSQSAGISGTWFSVTFAGRGRLRHELYIDSGSEERNQEIYDQLLSQRDELESYFGRPLDFEPLEDKRASRIADYSAGDVSEVEKHDEFIDWFFDSGERFRRALGQIQIV